MPFTLAQGTLLSAAGPTAALLLVTKQDGTTLQTFPVAADGVIQLSLPTDPRPAWAQGGVRSISFLAQMADGSTHITQSPDGRSSWPVDMLPLLGLKLMVGPPLQSRERWDDAVNLLQAIEAGAPGTAIGDIRDKLPAVATELQAEYQKLDVIGAQLGNLDAIVGNTGRLADVSAKLDTIQANTAKLADVAVSTARLGDLVANTSKLGDVANGLGDVATKLGKLDAIQANTGKLGDVFNRLGKLESIDAGMGRLADAAGKLAQAGAHLAGQSPSLESRGAEVQALHEDLVKLGYTVPENERSAQVFGVGTRDAVVSFQAKTGLRATGELDADTRSALDRAAATAAAEQSSVQGRVVVDDGRPAAGMKLRIYERGFGGTASLLAEGTTDQQGFYSLAYTPAGGAVHIEVRAVGADGKELPLSTTKFNAAKSEAMSFVAPASLQPLDTEYDRLAADLTKHVGDLVNLGDAREDDERRDLTLLYQSTGWDARLIALAAAAAKAITDTKLSHEMLYGLFRAGLPSDLQLLARTDADTVAGALRKARDAGVVNLTDQQITAARVSFEAFSATKRRAEKAPGAPSSVDAFLAQVDEAHKATFEKLYFAHRGTAAELWQKAADSGIPKATVDRLRVQGKLAHLTVNNADLVASLQNEIGSPDAMAQLVSKDLHRADAWTLRLKNLAGNDDQKLGELVPPAYAGDAVADRLAAYASDLARKVRLGYPMHVVRRMIEDDQQLGKHHSDVKAPLGAFLQTATERGFALGQGSLDGFVRDHREALFPVGTTEDQVRSTLEAARRLHRLYQVTPGNEALQALYDLGFSSAYEIASFPHEDFVRRFGPRFQSEQEAQLVYRKAQQVSSVTYGFFTAAKSLDSAPAMFVTSPPAAQAKVQSVKDNLVKQYPTMEALFGSLDFCACAECQSVLSPAAYLVDLLQFIDPDDQLWNAFLNEWSSQHNHEAYEKDWKRPNNQPRDDKDKRPYDALVERRPDLPCLPLTCENTNTVLPYIDVVNEILEYYVAKNGLDQGAAYDTGSASTAELLAEPQNVLSGAYEILRTDRYPMTLPFDLWIETVRRFFEHFDTPFWRVLEVFRSSDDLFPPNANPGPYYRADVFTERLGISGAEYAIFTDPAPLARWFELYGYAKEADATTKATDPNGQRVDLSSAKALSRRLGVSYQEIVDLVRTWFVNPHLEELTLLWKLGIEVGDVVRYKDPAATAEERAAFEQRVADRSARFGFNAKKWLDDAWATGTFAQILVLADPDAGCDFDKTTLQYADGTPADAPSFVRLNLFVRLWRKLGWTIEETDRALRTFVPAASTPLTGARIVNVGAAMKTALLYISHLTTLEGRVQVGKDRRHKLLTLWSTLPTTGKRPLYEQLFLTQSVLKSDAVFDDPLGNYLSKAGVLVKDHLAALQGALNLTADQVGLVLRDAGMDLATAPLSLANVSLLYRHGLLAKGLKLSVRDLLALKSLSGLDPFEPLVAGPVHALADDHPFSQTLAFLDVADAVRASGFSVEDLDYLLRHRADDPVGKYRSADDAPLALVRTLVSGIRRIRSERAMPADASVITDDWLRQQLALALPAGVVDTFMGMWAGTIEYKATLNDPSVANDLLSAAPKQTPPVVVGYDSVRQQVTFRGVLFDKQRAGLAGAVPGAAAMLAEVQGMSRAFFELHLQKQTARGKDVVGFLEASDFPRLFDEAQPDRRWTVAHALLPYLQQNLIRQFIVETMAASFGADPTLTESLLAGTMLLSDPTPFAAVADVGACGVTATFFSSNDRTGPPIALPKTLEAADTAAKVAGSGDPAPVGASSVRFEGYFEVPASGPFRFYAIFEKKAAAVELRIDPLPDPVLQGKAAKDGDEISNFTDLHAGVLYHFTFDGQSLGGGGIRLEILGASQPRIRFSQLVPYSGLVLYSSDSVERLRRARILLGKVLQIAQGFALDAEVAYLSTQQGRLDELAMIKLPTTATDDTPGAAAALFRQFLRLARYATLKRDLAVGGADLLSILDGARSGSATLDDIAGRIAAITRRDATVVLATAGTLGLGVHDLATENGLRRLWEALVVVEKLGVPIEAVARWATPSPDVGIAKDLRDTVKARYEAETWQMVAPSIFDKLRQRKRDALVAHIVHQQGFESVDQLFEYFLIDPGMEPVVQTSRLRLAISSVQTFIQRCLLNLEVHVRPSAILHAERWEWMKRYRVWEANRKIFLFPENWLEPEWRDDKTYLFQELEGALLQGDVSNDLAEDVFFRYLKGLDQIARLEIVTTYVEERDDPASNVLHVIGRTHAAPRKYFYRRYSKQMWTPWEPITVDIEGDHVVAAVWRDRLHLFWVTFLEKAASNTDNVNGRSHVMNLTLKSVFEASKGSIEKRLQFQLNWSEYFQGQWTARASSGFGPPTPILVTPNAAGEFDKGQVFVHVSKEQNGGQEGAVKIHLTGGLDPGATSGCVFRMVSKNAQPTIADTGAEPPPVLSYDDSLYDAHATRYTSNTGMNPTGALSVRFVSAEWDDEQKGIVNLAVDEILHNPANNATSFALTRPANPTDANALVVPFFYEDDQNTFYVEPALTEATIDVVEDWIISVPLPPSVPKALWDHVAVSPFIPMASRVEAEATVRQENAHALHAVGPREDWITNQAVAFTHGTSLVGASGAIDASRDVAGAVESAKRMRGVIAIGGGGWTSVPASIRVGSNRAASGTNR